MALDKLQTCYASKSTTLELCVLNVLFTLVMNNGTSMGDNISVIEVQFSRLHPTSTKSYASESVKVALPICSLLYFPEFGPMIASVNKFQMEDTKWKHASMLFIEESKRLIMRTIMKSSMENVHLPSQVSKIVPSILP